MIFDENVFPFAKLHSIAGARLRFEIINISPTLLNPNSSFLGGESVGDHVINPSANPANDVLENDCENLEENSAENTSNGAGEDGSRHEEDPPTIS